MGFCRSRHCGKIQKFRFFHKVLIYILGISKDTRNHFSQIYDMKSGCIKTKCLHEGFSSNLLWSFRRRNLPAGKGISDNVRLFYLFLLVGLNASLLVVSLLVPLQQKTASFTNPARQGVRYNAHRGVPRRAHRETGECEGCGAVYRKDRRDDREETEAA